MNNSNIKDIYTSFKYVLSGCRTLYDSLFFAQYYIKANPECTSLINGMIHGKNYEKIYDFRNMMNILNILDKFKTRNEIDEYINNNLRDNYDYAQMNALLRLGRTKMYNKENKEEENTNSIITLHTHTNDNLINLINPDKEDDGISNILSSSTVFDSFNN